MSAIDETCNVVANWMIARGYATGHGDTIDGLLSELVGQLRHFNKRPVAFRVPDGRGGWVVTQDEQEAIDIAEIVGADYDGLYVRKGQAPSPGDRMGEPKSDGEP